MQKYAKIVYKYAGLRTLKTMQKYAKYMQKHANICKICNPGFICRICTPHFADDMKVPKRALHQQLKESCC